MPSDTASEIARLTWREVRYRKASVAQAAIAARIGLMVEALDVAEAAIAVMIGQGWHVYSKHEWKLMHDELVKGRSHALRETGAELQVDPKGTKVVIEGTYIQDDEPQAEPYKDDPPAGPCGGP